MKTINYMSVLCPHKRGQTSELCDRLCEDCPFSKQPQVEITYSSGLWQCCPKCAGEGIVSTKGLSSATTEKCDVCNGKKIISKITGLPPQS